VGDFNADGLADFLIGSPGPLAEPGKVFLVFGSRDFAEKVELARLHGLGVVIQGSIPFGGLEVRAHGTGDLDGDGASDIALGERGFEDMLGQVHVVYGVAPETEFTRGDSNFDDRIDVSDAVFTLNFLFLGGIKPACDDAVDTDDTGSMDITDAVRLLDHLFRSGPAPPAPHPEPGPDPTADALRCRGF
jgi:hypothetical protein